MTDVTGFIFYSLGDSSAAICAKPTLVKHMDPKNDILRGAIVKKGRATRGCNFKLYSELVLFRGSAKRERIYYAI